MKLNRRSFLKRAGKWALAGGLIYVPRRATALPNGWNNPTAIASGGSPTPVLRWKFDEGSGSTTADSSGNGYTGTLNNSPSWVAHGAGISTPSSTSPYCLQFIGSSSQDVATSGTISQMGGISNASLSAWYYVASTSAYVSFGFSTSGSRFCFTAFSSNIYIVTTSAYGAISTALTGWHFLCFVFNGLLIGNANRAVLYIDGSTSPSTLTFNGTVPTALPSSASLGTFYAARDMTDATYMTGGLDDIQLFTTSLTAAQNAAIYTAGAQ